MSVKVAVRVRPMSDKETKAGAEPVIRMDGNTVTANNDKTFAYDNAFWSNTAAVAGNKNSFASQETVYDALGKEVVAHNLEGYNACIFAYGQTGSGKTYSMMGSEGEEGIIPRLAKDIFKNVADLKKAKIEAAVEVSFMEVYNEKVRCLLNPDSQRENLRVREHPITGPYVEGLTKVVAQTPEDFLMLLDEGNQVRTTGETAMNTNSSRSHAVFTVTLTQKKKEGALITTTTSRLNLVDLAGSERADKTQASGSRLAEGANINKSLSSLGNVISNLTDPKSAHIPYRDSVLTWILKENLGGNSKTIMLATVSPAADQLEETISTLRFAERAKKVQNKAVVNSANNSEVIAKLQKEIEALKAQLAASNGADRAKIQEDIAVSEAVKNDLAKSLEEKLAETERVMLQREASMQMLLELKDTEIQELNQTLSQKDEEIVRLMAEVDAKIKKNGNRDEGPEADEIDRLRAQIAKLETQQTSFVNKQRRLSADARGKTPSKKTAGDIGGETLHKEDLGNVGAKVEGGRVTVRALARAFDALGKEASPIVVKRGQDFPSEEVDEALAAIDESGPQDSLLEYLGDELNLDEVHEGDDDPLELDLEGEGEAGDEEVDLEIDADELEIDAEDGEEEVDLELDADELEIDAEEDEPELELEQEEMNLEAPAMEELELEAGDEDEEIEIDEDAVEETPAEAAAKEETKPKEPVPARARALTTAVKKDADTGEKKGPVIHQPASTVSTLVVPSHALPNNRYLREPFRVVKIDEGAVFGAKKDRIWDIDIFAKKFSNLDMSGYVTFTQPSTNLFRVEKSVKDNKRMTLYFFDAPHPYELEFTCTERRQRFFELATLLRRNSILWCPSLCIEGETDAVVQVAGTTINRPNGKVAKVKGDAKFMVARMPYEVIDFWFGCFSMQGRAPPRNSSVLASFLPKGGHEVFIIGLTDVPGNLMGTRELGEYFLSYLGRNSFYVLGNTAISSRDKGKAANNVMIMIVRRSFIVRMSHIQALEVTPARKDNTTPGDFTAVGCAVKINEASIAVILVNGNPTMVDPHLRSSNIRGLMNNFPLGNSNVDIGARFDYLIVAGAFGYHGSFTQEDELAAQMRVGNVISDFSEAKPNATLAAEMNPMRIFYQVKPRTCRLDVKSYQTSRALNLNNAFISGDLFCQRVFMSTFGEQVPRCQLHLSELKINGARIPHVNNAELHITGEWIDAAPVVYQLQKSGDSYSLKAKNPNPIRPVICNYEFLRLQSMEMTLWGIMPGKDKQKMIVASATVPLKNQFTMAEAVPTKATMYYRACAVGALSLSILQVNVEGDGVQSLQGEGAERNAVAVTCYENQVLDAKGAWCPALLTKDGAWDWSTCQDRTTESRREAVELPNGAEWKWLTEWRHENRPEDKNGWHYAVTFESGFAPRQNKYHQVRRRQWNRVMQAADPLVLHNYVTKAK